MLNLLLSLLLGGAAFAIAAAFGGYETESFRPVYGIVPGLLTFGLAYVLLSRRVMKRFERAVKEVEGELVKALDPNRKASRKQRDMAWERAVSLLEAQRSLAPWQFFLASQIEAQIGIILYLKGDLDEAQPHLEKAFARNWLAYVMLGALHFRKGDVEAMRRAFDHALRVGRKESFAWAVYAWCLWRSGDRDGAIEVLNRATKKIDDERLAANLLAIKNNRKMKMEGWREQWYQLQLVRPKVQRVAGGRYPGGKISKRQLYG